MYQAYTSLNLVAVLAAWPAGNKKLYTTVALQRVTICRISCIHDTSPLTNHNSSREMSLMGIPPIKTYELLKKQQVFSRKYSLTYSLASICWRRARLFQTVWTET